MSSPRPSAAQPKLTDERRARRSPPRGRRRPRGGRLQPDYRERALAYRAIGQLRFNQKTELLRRGLEDESPAARGSALLSLELLSRDHQGVVNAVRGTLHSLANEDPNAAVRRLAILCAQERLAQADTLTLLAHLAEEEDDKDLRAAAPQCTAR